MVSIKRCLFAAVCHLLTQYLEQDGGYSSKVREEEDILCAVHSKITFSSPLIS